MFQTNQEHCPQNSTDNESSMVVLAKTALKFTAIASDIALPKSHIHHIKQHKFNLYKI